MNFIIRLKYRFFCSCWAVVIQKFTWISRTNSIFKLKLEKGCFFFSLLRLVFVFFLRFAGINCAGSRRCTYCAHVRTYMCVCVWVVYMLIYLYYVCARSTNRKAKPATTWVSALPVLMAFGLFMLPRIRHTHTHTLTYTHIQRLPYWVTISLQGLNFLVSVYVFFFRFFNPSTDAG